jgi:calcium-dependent protein kinase
MFAVPADMPDVACPPELAAPLAKCLADFEVLLQEAMAQQVHERVHSLHVALCAALHSSRRSSRRSSEDLPYFPGTQSQEISDNRLVISKETPGAKALKRETTIVFKKQEEMNKVPEDEKACPRKLSLTRQSIKSGGEDVRRSLLRLQEGGNSMNPPESCVNPILEFFGTKKGKPDINIKEFSKALQEGKIDTKYLDVPVDPSTEIPAPLFFAIGTKNVKLVKLLVEHRCDARQKFTGEKMWSGIRTGQTPMEAVSNIKGRFIGTVLEEKYELMEEVLRSEEDRLRGWKSGALVSQCANAGERSWRLQNHTPVGKEKSSAELETPEAPPRNGEQGEEDDEEDEITEEQEAELEAKSRAMRAKLGRDSMTGGSKTQRRKSVSLYTSKSAFVCEHIRGDPSEMYELGDKLGEGTFGYVRKGINQLTRVPRAIKTVPKVLLQDSGLWQEIEIMRELDHPHIMKLFSTYEDHENLYLVCELCSGGDLVDALSESGNFSEQVAGQLFKQMIGAVCYLHGQGICHRDLKPENFLLSMPEDLQKVHVKLIDFGAARRFARDGFMTTKICALHYVAPELVSKKEVQYNEKCDVWSLGVVLYLMLCGSPPFYGDDEMGVLKDIRKGRYTYEPRDIWEGVGKKAKDLIDTMLVVNPSARLAASEVASSTWFEEVCDLHPADLTQALVYQMRAFGFQVTLKKIALQVIAQQLSDEMVAGVRMIFDSLDTHAKGSLKVSELAKAIKKVALPDVTENDINLMLAEVSQHDTMAQVSYTQFLAATIDHHQYLRSEDTVRAAFNVFDLKAQNSFGEFELTYLIRNNEVLEHLSQSGKIDIKTLIEEVDLNEDGRIDFDEFLEMMRQEGAIPLSS